MVPVLEKQNNPCADTVALIEDPYNGYRFVGLFGTDNFAVYNCQSLVKDEDTILHFEYYNTEEVLPNNLHREYSNN